MTQESQTTPVIANAIVWAAVIIATALIMADAGGDRKMSLLLLQIVGWYAVNLTLLKAGNSPKAEWACLRKRFGGTKKE